MERFHSLYPLIGTLKTVISPITPIINETGFGWINILQGYLEIITNP